MISFDLYPLRLSGLSECLYFSYPRCSFISSSSISLMVSPRRSLTASWRSAAVLISYIPTKLRRNSRFSGLISERRCRLVFLGSSEELCCLLMRDIINHPPSKSTIAGWDGFQLTEFCSHSRLCKILLNARRPREFSKERAALVNKNWTLDFSNPVQ